MKATISCFLVQSSADAEQVSGSARWYLLVTWLSIMWHCDLDLH